MLDPALRKFVESPFAKIAMGGFEKLEHPRQSSLRVLTYHRVRRATEFSQTIDHLQSRYTFVGLDQVLDAIRRPSRLPPRSLMLTFDDAYDDFSRIAWPRLKSSNIPALVFVPTAYPDSPSAIFWWDRLQDAFNNTPRRDEIESPAGNLSLGSPKARRRAFRKLRGFVKTCPHDELLHIVDEICTALEALPSPSEVMSWDTLRTLAKDGVALACHTRTHPLLTRVSAQTALEEVRGAQDDLLREIGSAPPVFAYPSGFFDRSVRNMLAAEGFEIAFTTIRGTNDLDREDPLRLRRINIGEWASAAVVRARILESAPMWNTWRPVGRSFG
jgi:peptidoglycan/xylan/chitin deacetylase (PgdA/CDA1 family)